MVQQHPPDVLLKALQVGTFGSLLLALSLHPFFSGLDPRCERQCMGKAHQHLLVVLHKALKGGRNKHKGSLQYIQLVYPILTIVAVHPPGHQALHPQTYTQSET